MQLARFVGTWACSQPAWLYAADVMTVCSPTVHVCSAGQDAYWVGATTDGLRLPGKHPVQQTCHVSHWGLPTVCCNYGSTGRVAVAHLCP